MVYLSSFKIFFIKIDLMDFYVIGNLLQRITMAILYLGQSLPTIICFRWIYF